VKGIVAEGLFENGGGEKEFEIRPRYILAIVVSGIGNIFLIANAHMFIIEF
jgi:hypothetical protein